MKHKLFCRDCEAEASTQKIGESELPEGWTDVSPYGVLFKNGRGHQATCPVHNDDFDHQPPQDDDDNGDDINDGWEGPERNLGMPKTREELRNAKNDYQ